MGQYEKKIEKSLGVENRKEKWASSGVIYTGLLIGSKGEII